MATNEALNDAHPYERIQSARIQAQMIVYRELARLHQQEILREMLYLSVPQFANEFIGAYPEIRTSIKEGSLSIPTLCMIVQEALTTLMDPFVQEEAGLPLQGTTS